MKQSSIEKVVFLAIAQERERCARIAESLPTTFAPADYQISFGTNAERHQQWHGDCVAARIRAATEDTPHV